MLSIQETVQKDQVKTQLREIRNVMDSYGQFHPAMASIFNVENESLRHELHETLGNIPLREFLAKSGTTGIAGAAYLVPDKLHDELVMYSMPTDIVALISSRVIEGWPGGDLKVDIVSDESYDAHEFVSGGQLPSQTVETMQATLSPVSFGINAQITSDLIEDANFGMVEFHLQKAALGMGAKSSDLALEVMHTATDGWGTLNTEAASADETLWLDVGNAIATLTDDRWIANTIVITTEAWEHSVSKGIGKETAGGAAGDFWQPDHAYTIPNTRPVAEGFDFKTLNIDWLFNNSPALHSGLASGTAMVDCDTLVFDRNNALLTGRKRWMQINNYADPVRDLAGATITARQDSVTLYDDAICKITET